MLSTGRVQLVFAAFALAYFLSALLRAVTATLAPALASELGLQAGDLGLLAGAYFLGFAAMQLPLGRALDGRGPRQVELALLALAVVGCIAFAMARGMVTLFLARALIGVGVSACLMAPLTAYRRLFTPQAQLRANSWMLMTGSLGMLASTLPVQWLLPRLGWRGVFVLLALALVAAMAVILAGVPPDGATPRHDAAQGAVAHRYRDIVRQPIFVRMLPLGFFIYGGMIAMQALWAGPWLTQVHGASAQGAAQGLFVINLSMLVAFLSWGLAMPRLMKAGWSAGRLIALAWPLSAGGMAVLAWAGPAAGPGSWALWCVCTSAVSLSQPAVGQAFPAGAAGRALSAYNLVIFAGVFAMQWGVGLAIDALQAAGAQRVDAYRLAMVGFALACAGSGAWFRWHGQRIESTPQPGAQ